MTKTPCQSGVVWPPTAPFTELIQISHPSVVEALHLSRNTQMGAVDA
ncbi:hypothetical protein [Pararhodobacter zhoushanensis]|nr:hypothetical protein [Pararhodobacter zhoushanensis]